MKARLCLDRIDGDSNKASKTLELMGWWASVIISSTGKAWILDTGSDHVPYHKKRLTYPKQSDCGAKGVSAVTAVEGRLQSSVRGDLVHLVEGVFY